MKNTADRNHGSVQDRIFEIWGLACTFLGILLLMLFIGHLLFQGAGRLSWDFLFALPSRFPEQSGIRTALAGSVWILILTAAIAFPIGISTALYMEEYQTRGRFFFILEANISNLAGVPSIIYGLVGLELFARFLHLGGSLLTGSLTLSMLILPIIIVTTREAIRAVPPSLKEAAYALGASRWQTMWLQVLPVASGGILTGGILALSRAIGEAAPLIVIGALAYVPFAPTHPLDDFTILPIQIFHWISRPQAGFHTNAAAGILVLLAITFAMNGIAVYLRYRWQKKINL